MYNDTSKPDSYQSMIDTVVAAEGRIDGLVNNFGGTNPAEDKDLLSTSSPGWMRTWAACSSAVRRPRARWRRPAAVCFLGDESAATTGQLIEVAGGFGLATPIYADAMDAAVAR